MALTLERLRAARLKVADLASRNALLKPVFDRVDREYKAMLTAPEMSPLEQAARRYRDVQELA